MIIGGVVLAVIAIVTVALVLLLKKPDHNDPFDPNIEYFNPYKVLEADPDQMYYKIARNT